MLAFSGKFIYTLDAKGRVSVPASFRSQLAKESDNTFHVTFGPNECLFAYPREVFMHIAARLEEKYGSLSSNDEERRFFLETMASAQPCRCDQQGRIIIPQEHLDYAKIDGEVLIIGAVNKFEFWNPERYDEFIKGSKFTKEERIRMFGGADRG